MTFKVGDRVKAVTDGGYESVKPGDTGTVVEVASPEPILYEIEWDDDKGVVDTWPMWAHEVAAEV